MENRVKRAYDLYDLLMTEPNKWFTQEEIVNNCKGYKFYDRSKKMDRCPDIRLDVLFLNAEADIEKIVVISRYRYKIADKKEVDRYYYGQIKRLKQHAKQLKDLEYKMRRDGHGDIIDHRFWETYWNEN